MIFRLLLLILLPLMAYYFVRSISQRFSLTARQNRLLFFLVASLLVIAVLIAIGRLPAQFILAPIGVAATFLIRMLPMLLRLLPMWHLFKGRSASAKPRSERQTSTIRTLHFEMELRHDDGSMDGSVLSGSYAGSRLSELDLPQLLELHQQARGDTDSLQVLEAYMDRTFADWREHYQGSGSESSSPTHDDAAMTEALALEILGLEAGADKKTVIKAHRSLMQKMHPDRGGSDYLAQKINAAKDYRVERLS